MLYSTNQKLKKIPDINLNENKFSKSKQENENLSSDLISNCTKLNDNNENNVNKLLSTNKDINTTEKINSLFGSDKIIITEVEGDSSITKVDKENLQIVSHVQNVDEGKVNMENDKTCLKIDKEVSLNSNDNELNLNINEENKENTISTNKTIKSELISDNNKNNYNFKSITNSTIKICETFETVTTKSESDEENEETCITAVLKFTESNQPKVIMESNNNNTTIKENENINLSKDNSKSNEILIYQTSSEVNQKQLENSHENNTSFLFDETTMSMNFPYVISATKKLLISEKSLASMQMFELNVKVEQTDTESDIKKEVLTATYSSGSSSSSTSYSSDSEKPIRPNRKTNKRKQSSKDIIKNENNYDEQQTKQQQNIDKENTRSISSSDDDNINNKITNLNSYDEPTIKSETSNEVIKLKNVKSDEKDVSEDDKLNSIASSSSPVKQENINNSNNASTVKVVKVLPKVESDLTALKRSLEMDLNQTSEDSGIDISKDFIDSPQKLSLPLTTITSKLYSQDDQVDSNSNTKRHLPMLIYQENNDEIKSFTKPIERIILGVEHHQQIGTATKTVTPQTTIISEENQTNIDINTEGNHQLNATENSTINNKSILEDDSNEKDINKGK